MNPRKIVEVVIYNLFIFRMFFRLVNNEKIGVRRCFAKGIALFQHPHRKSMKIKSVIDYNRQSVFVFQIFERQINRKMSVYTVAYFCSVKVDFALMTCRTYSEPINFIFFLW